jgi:hypothetical protein
MQARMFLEHSVINAFIGLLVVAGAPSASVASTSQTVEQPHVFSTVVIAEDVEVRFVAQIMLSFALPSILTSSQAHAHAPDATRFIAHIRHAQPTLRVVLSALFAMHSHGTNFC